MDIISWLEAIAAGAVFGVFPAWWYCSAMIVNAAAFKGKVVPKWLIMLARSNPGPGLFSLQLWGKRCYPKILQIMAVVWVSGFILFFQIMAFIGEVQGYVIGILDVDLGVIPFLLLTFIIPVYFLNRFLQHAKQRTIWNQNSPLDE
jgi:hypothetical protein